MPPEGELCEACGVSRVTVRESLKKLEMMNLLSIEQGRGTFVNQTNPRPFHAADVQSDRLLQL